MHELTKKLRGTEQSEWDTAIICYMREKSEWLKGRGKIFYNGKTSEISLDTIDEAFGLTHKTLEEKFELVIREFPSPVMSKDFAEIARQHFREHPEELEGGR